jgi:hypothetical protein
MARLSDSAYQKELEAQKKRVQALKHLDDNGCGPTRFESTLSTKGVTQAMAEKKTTKSFSTDNTLEQVRKQKANQINSGVSLKTLLLEQQVDILLLLTFSHFQCRVLWHQEMLHFLRIGKLLLIRVLTKLIIGINQRMRPLGKDQQLILLLV